MSTMTKTPKSFASRAIDVVKKPFMTPPELMPDLPPLQEHPIRLDAGRRLKQCQDAIKQTQRVESVEDRWEARRQAEKQYADDVAAGRKSLADWDPPQFTMRDGEDPAAAAQRRIAFAALKPAEQAVNEAHTHADQAGYVVFQAYAEPLRQELAKQLGAVLQSSAAKRLMGLYAELERKNYDRRLDVPIAKAFNEDLPKLVEQLQSTGADALTSVNESIRKQYERPPVVTTAD